MIQTWLIYLFLFFLTNFSFFIENTEKKLYRNYVNLYFVKSILYYFLFSIFNIIMTRHMRYKKAKIWILFISVQREVMIEIFKVLQTIGKIWKVIWEYYARCHSYKKNNLRNGSYDLLNPLFLCIRKNNKELKGVLVIKTKELCYIIVF